MIESSESVYNVTYAFLPHMHPHATYECISVGNTRRCLIHPQQDDAVFRLLLFPLHCPSPVIPGHPWMQINIACCCLHLLAALRLGWKL